MAVATTRVADTMIGADDVGQHVLEDDAAVLAPMALRRLDELLLAQARGTRRG